MPRRSPRSPLGWIVPLACAGPAWLAAATGDAQPPRRDRCDDPRVTIDVTLPEVWRKAAIAACAALRDVPDTDPGARLRVARRAATAPTPKPEGVVVEATLADGRHTVREVAAPADLRLTLEALAVKPPPEPPPVATPAASPAAPPSASPTSPPSASPAAPPPPPRANAQPWLQAQIALWVVGRYAGRPDYLSVGPTLSADLAFGPWIVGLLGRWEAYQAVVNTPLVDFTMQTAGAGLFGGRRVLDWPSARVDVGLGVVVLAQTQGFSGSLRGDDDDDGPSGAGRRGGTAADARIGVFVRAAYGESTVRWLAALEGEISPLQIDATTRVDPMGPPLPGVSAALSVGVAFATGLAWSAP